MVFLYSSCCYYCNFSVDSWSKTYKIPPMKNTNLTVDEKLALVDVLETIDADDDLRRGFRNYCNIKVPELRKIVKKLRVQAREGLDAGESKIIIPVDFFQKTS